MRMLSFILVFLCSTALAQPVVAPPRKVTIQQKQGTQATVITLDGTKDVVVHPTQDGKLTITQEGAPTRVLPNSNQLTWTYSGLWAKCPARPGDAHQILSCPAGTEGNWQQSHGWAQAAYPACWVALPWQPTTPPEGSCTVIPTCPARPADETRNAACPAGTVGTFVQTHGWTANPPPLCWTANAWVPLTPPSGSCPPDNPPPPAGTLVIDLSYVNRTSAEYTRFKQYVDRAVGGNRDYGFSAVDAAYMAKLDGGQQYCGLAVSMVESQVSSAEQRIAAGQNPEIAGDSYLHVGDMLADLDLTYTWCNARITDQQKTRWVAYANQAIFNVWNPAQAKWGGRLAPWSGWSINDPANNYYYSFMRASEYNALALNDSAQLAYLSGSRWPLLVNFYNTIPGGGSTEGSGYGASHRGLFELYQVWKDSGQGDFANANTHLTNSIYVWVHSTVPTLDKFHPSGDQSRVSEPVIYDYQRGLVAQAWWQTNNAAAKSVGGWWLKHIDNQNMQSSFNYRYNLFPIPSTDPVPTALGYRAPETGFTFARTSWAESASWIGVVAGVYNQVHAHQEQGGFTLYKGNWLTVTNNIWSHSGINQSTIDKNIVRFEKNGAVQGQRMNQTTQVSGYSQEANGDMHITMGLTPFYGSASGVTSWVRKIDFVAGVTTVNDDMNLATGTVGVFQVNVPSQPSVAGNVVTAGNLRFTVLSPASPQITLVDMRTVNSDYNSGWRVDIKGGATNYKVQFNPQ